MDSVPYNEDSDSNNSFGLNSIDGEMSMMGGETPSSIIEATMDNTSGQKAMNKHDQSAQQENQTINKVAGFVAEHPEVLAAVL